ncbi:alpha-mannosidase 2 [Eucyclogobius newberryi]|uniref:alpha-mannosidase 2 n=1 Tax=Eucyclogobius newberryi TaxID=166745 RepID=UPI003B5A5969
MKRSRTLFLVGVVFCIAVVIIYRSLEQLQPIRAQDLPQEVELAQVQDLQLRMTHLEEMLRTNNLLVSELDHALNASWEKRGGAQRGRAKGPVPDCPLAEKKRGGAEVQMLDVYDLLPFDNPDGGAWKQGFPIHYHGNEWNNQSLQVFLVPHSHNDPGWLKTFDQYYQDQTKHILDNMVQFLSEDSRRTMIWAEISYFSKWWNNIDEQKKSMVKKLLLQQRLELVTGGWVMADEANSHYFALLDQLMEGHQWIQNNLGVKPANGWAIDPFGHSPSMSYLLKGAGLKNHVIQRVHYSVKKHFAQQHLLEFNWRQSWDPSPITDDITCHMMPFYSYDVPHTCGPNPAVCCQFDFHRLPGGKVFCPWRIAPQPINAENVKERALLLLDQYRQKSRLFQTPVLLVPLGDDFRFVDRSEWQNQFKNYQLLFDFMNQSPELHVKARFGTLKDYFEALHKHLDSSQERLPAVGGDFFTYADRDDHYWSGYFTSRPFYKRLDRALEATLRGAEILFSLALAESRRLHSNLFPGVELFGHLTSGRRSLALFQHHDAVTGTARDAVVRDYGNKLLDSILKLQHVIQSSAHLLLLSDKSQFDQSQPLLQMDDVIKAHDALPQKTVIKVGDKPRTVVVYNPLEHRRTTVVTVTVDTTDVTVLEAETYRTIVAQISAVWEETTKASSSTFQLSFVVDLPPLSLSVYHVTKAPTGPALSGPALSGPAVKSVYRVLGSGFQAVGFSVIPVLTDSDLSIRNSHLEVFGSAPSGLMQKLRLPSGQVQQVQVQFLWYGTRSDRRDKSGAYLFLPGDEGAKPYDWLESPVVRVSVGPVFSDITSCFRHVTHTVRLFHIKGHEGRSLQIQNTVDIRSEFNRELVMRLVTDISNGNSFFSDLNGFQMLQRRTLGKLPLQANFYPMTSAAFLQDQDQNQDQTRSRLTLLSAQSQAVAALKPGFLELVLDRRLQQDDNRGLGQGVTDNKCTQSQLHLLMEEVGGAWGSHLSLLAHLSSLSIMHPVVTMATPEPSTHASKISPYTAISSSLPCDLHLLNMRTLESQQEAGSPSQEVALLLHRKGFDCNAVPAPKPACTWREHQEINLSDVLAPLRLRSVRPSGLTLLRLDEQPDSAHQEEHKIPPMEIRAFRVQLQ